MDMARTAESWKNDVGFLFDAQVSAIERPQAAAAQAVCAEPGHLVPQPLCDAPRGASLIFEQRGLAFKRHHSVVNSCSVVLRNEAGHMLNLCRRCILLGRLDSR